MLAAPSRTSASAVVTTWGLLDEVLRDSLTTVWSFAPSDSSVRAASSCEVSATLPILSVFPGGGCNNWATIDPETKATIAKNHFTIAGVLAIRNSLHAAISGLSVIRRKRAVLPNSLTKTRAGSTHSNLRTASTRD